MQMFKGVQMISGKSSAKRVLDGLSKTIHYFKKWNYFIIIDKVLQ